MIHKTNVLFHTVLVAMEFSARIFIESFKAEFEHTSQPCPGSVAHILAYMMDHKPAEQSHMPAIDACIMLIVVSPEEILCPDVH